MTSKNDITGDSIINNKGDKEKFASGWDAIWGKKKEPKNEEPVILSVKDDK